MNVCPTCGKTIEHGCLPSRCPRWETVAVFDHDAREWLPTDPDGFTLDGRRIEDVR
jgi:hypothetical protein